jgi:hypothetical protein
MTGGEIASKMALSGSFGQVFDYSSTTHQEGGNYRFTEALLALFCGQVKGYS